MHQPSSSNWPARRPNAMVFAGQRYHRIDAEARVAGASPHKLVSILFEELLGALDAAIAARRAQADARFSEQRFKALGILLALESSLDFRAGGDLALSLARIYREAGRQIRSVEGDADSAPITSARRMIAEIAAAWFAIGEGG